MSGFQIIANLTGTPDGANPSAGLAIDAAGNLFGTTAYGGAHGAGTVFEIPFVNGKYTTPVTLVSFDSPSVSSPIGPSGALLIDASGNLFGTTSQDGSLGGGTIFEVVKTASGYSTTATTLYTSPDKPIGSLLMDATGDLIGATQYGGSLNEGTVFELRNVTGQYAIQPITLANFQYYTTGDFPRDGLIMDAAGNLFGTTSQFGPGFPQSGGGTLAADGTVYRIDKTATGYASTPTVIAQFNGTDGDSPGALVMDSEGVLFGVTAQGGANNDGTIFEIPLINGIYSSTPTTLYSFSGTDGIDPGEGDKLLINSDGNIYGTAGEGGVSNTGYSNVGTVFELEKTDTGYANSLLLLHTFNGDGAYPNQGLIQTPLGIVGTTFTGGTTGAGSVFALTDTPKFTVDFERSFIGGPNPKNIVPWQGPTVISPTLTISSSVPSLLLNATVFIQDNAAEPDSTFLAGDTLAANGLAAVYPKLSWSYDSASGVMTISGADTLADYESFLRQITYSSNSVDPTNNGTDTERFVIFELDDGSNADLPELTQSTNLDLTPPPTLEDLAKASGAVYGNGDIDLKSNQPPYPPLPAIDTGAGAIPGPPTHWQAFMPKSTSDFQAVTYVNPNQSVAIIAIEGTANLSQTKTDAATWLTGVASHDLLTYLSLAADYVKNIQDLIAQSGDNVQIYLTGHSLGGAIAQMVGAKANLPAIGFNAPGTDNLYNSSSVQAELAELTPADGAAALNLTVRVQGDIVSTFGRANVPAALGNIKTITSTDTTDLVSTTNIQANALSKTDHSDDTVIAELLLLGNGSVNLANGIPASDFGKVGDTLDLDPESSVVTTLGIDAVYAIAGLVTAGYNLIDPPKRYFSWDLKVAPGSPAVTGIVLPDAGGASSYILQTGGTNGVLSAPTTVQPGATVSLPMNTQEIKVNALRSSGANVALPANSSFYVNTSGAGTLSGTLETIGNPASSDFNGDANSDFLFQNDSGQAAVWLLNGSEAPDGALVGANPGPAWHIKGAGDFDGDGKADILWQNENGQAAVWLLNGTSETGGALVGSNPGSSWHIKGTGDFNGDGKTDIVWQNDAGQAAIWLMNGTNIVGGALLDGNPGPLWHIVGTGDFNDDGMADILWQNADGQAAIWMMNGTTVQSAALAGSNPGTSWHIKGSGDFDGDGKSDILWQNDDGQAAIWFMDGASETVGILAGSNLDPSWQVVGAGDVDGDGFSDIRWQKSDGEAAVWTMSGGNLLNAAVVGGNPGTAWHMVAGGS